MVNATTLSFWGNRANVTVIGREGKGFRVQLHVCPGSDEMIETLHHEALFAARWDAEALAEKVRKAGAVNVAHWVWGATAASPYAFMHAQPTAKLERVARAASAAVPRYAFD